MSKTIMVTGGAGFLGANLCRKLLDADDNTTVICVDNLYTGKESNIVDLLKRDNFSFLKHDVICEFHEDIIVDEIYNLACPASPSAYQLNPVNTVLTNVLGARNVLELAKRNNAKVLQASTSEVYGNPIVHPQVESYQGNVNCTGIRACYDEGKRCAEALFFDYHRMYDIRIKVIRIFNTYGPYMSMNDGRVVSNFIVQSLNNEPITLYGDGSQTRSLCYVDDLLDGMISMMNTDDKFCGPVNLGNPDERTVKWLAYTIKEMTGSKSEVISVGLPKDDPVKRCPNISLATEKLGWVPKIGVFEGLKRTVAYFEEIIEKEKSL